MPAIAKIKVLVIMLTLVVLSQSDDELVKYKACPIRNWKPPDCDARCRCDWAKSTSCNDLTGKCVCKTGWQGHFCNEDVNECLGNAEICKKNEDCENVAGSYLCKCRAGFVKSQATGICRHCDIGSYGPDCNNSCRCITDNTFTCLPATGECLCLDGWEGEHCIRNVDDCVNAPCPRSACTDLHRGYRCDCGKDRVQIEGKCVDLRIDFISFNLEPAIGEWVDIFFFFHFGPKLSVQKWWENLKSLSYQLKIKDGKDICKVLISDKQYITNKEDFAPKLKTLDTTYTFYIQYRIRFTVEGRTIIQAVSNSQIYVDQFLVFQVRYKSSSTRGCLTNMTITHAQPDFNPVREQFTYKRQEFIHFKSKFQLTSDCKDDPRVEWTYYTVNTDIFGHRINKGLCITPNYFSPIDISDKIYRSGNREITDHKDKLEVIPKATFDISTVMVCLMAFVEMDVTHYAVTCSLLKIIHSGLIHVEIYPHASSITLVQRSELNLMGFAWDPDNPHLAITYRWFCKIMLTNPPRFDPRKCFNEEGPVTSREFKYKYDWFYKAGYNPRVEGMNLDSYYEIMLMAYSKWNTRHRGVKTIDVWQQWEGSEIQLSIDGCNKGYRARCGHVYSTSEVVRLKLSLIPNTLVNRKRTRWYVFEDGKELSRSETNHIISSWYQGKARPIMMTFPNSLKPGKTYKIELRASQRTVKSDYGHSSYTFRTESIPVGKGCTIKPNKGKAVFTAFEIECKDYSLGGDEAHLPLAYAVYQKDKTVEDKEEVETLIAYSGESVLKGITLSQLITNDDVGKELKVQLRVVISSVVKGSYTEVPLEVKIVTDDQSHIVNKVGAKTSEKSIGDQESVRNVKDIATVMNFEGKATHQDKSRVRGRLLSNMNSFDSTTSTKVMHASFAMQATAAETREIEYNAVDDGVSSVRGLTEYLGKVSASDFNKTLEVARYQLLSMGNLVSVMHDFGMDTATGKTIHEEKEVALLRSRGQGEQTIQALSNMGRVLARSLTGDNEPVKLNTSFLDLHIEWQNVSDSSKFDLASSDGSINFVLPTKAMGILKNEGVTNKFEVYRKSPFSYNGDHVHGDLPVIMVKFTSMSKTKQKNESATWRFSKPADIVMQYKPQTSGVLSFETYLVVNTISKEIIQTSCVAMSIRASTESYTLLILENPDNFKLKIKARYTNAIGAFELLTDEELLDIPLPGTETYESPQGTLFRKNNFIFLPQLTGRQKKQDTPAFRIQISIALGQVIPDNLPMADTTNMTLNTGNFTELYVSNITLTPYDMSCVHLDQSSGKYMSKDCRLSQFSNLEKLHCKCVVAAAYSGSILVMPVLIDPMDIGLFLKIFENPLVVSMSICLWILYSTGIVWGRRKDKADAIKNSVTVLEDNDPEQTYVYLICVVTGLSSHAATSSTVHMFFRGTWGITPSHTFRDRSRLLFQSGSEDWFVMTTDEDIGEITSAVVWTDFSGPKPHWFLSTIYIQNMQTKESWTCSFNSWLSTTYGIGQIVMEIPARKDSELSSETGAQLMSKGKNDLRNEHLWIGIFTKTAYNKFTRVRRFTTGMTMLQSCMLLNLMFFEVRNIDDSRQFITLSGLTLHLTSIIIGIQTSVIMTVIGLTISFIFNRIAPMPAKVLKVPETTGNVKTKKSIFRPLTFQVLSDSGSHGSYERREREPSEEEAATRTKSSEEAHKVSTKDKSSEKAHKASNRSRSSEEARKASTRTKSSEEAHRVSTQTKSSEEVHKVSTRDKSSKKAHKASTSSSAYSGDGEEYNRREDDYNENARSSGSGSEEEQNDEEVHDVFGATRTKLFGGEELDPTRRGIAEHEIDLQEAEKRLKAKMADAIKKKEERRKLEKELEELEALEVPEDPPSNAFRLPYWLIFIIWGCLAFFNIFLSYYTMLYGLSMGYERSLDWVTAFFTGFLTDLIFVQPIKVTGMVFVFVLIFKQRHTYKEQAPVAELKESMQLLDRHRALINTIGRVAAKQEMEQELKPPPRSSQAKALLERLRIEGAAREMLRDLILYNVFIVMILLITYGHMGVTKRFDQTTIVKEIFSHSFEEAEVFKVEDVWDYLTETLVPDLTPTVYGTIKAMDIYLLGTARVRQVRIQEDTSICDYGFKELIEHFGRDKCSFSVDSGTEETRDFVNDTWKAPSYSAVDEMDSPFKYRTSAELNSFTVHGKRGFYPGGGYITVLSQDDPHATSARLIELCKAGWIDHLTRALFIEFTLYSPNSNIFTRVRVIFEFDNFGAVFVNPKFESSELFFYNKENKWLEMIEMITVILATFYTVVEFRSLWEKGFWAYFRNVWNCMEMIVLALTFTAGILFYKRHEDLKATMREFQKYGRSRYTDFNKVFDTEAKLQVVVGFLGAFSIIKILKIITFNPFMAAFTKSIVIVSRELIAYSIMTAVYMLGFCIFGTFSFGQLLEGYSTFLNSLFTVVMFVLGEPDYEALVSVNDFIGKAYFLVVMMVTQFIIVNFFISILREGLELARYMRYKEEEATLAYMKNSVYLYLGFKPKANNKNEYARS